MASRFFATSVYDSDSEDEELRSSSEEELLSSSDEEELASSEDDDDDDDDDELENLDDDDDDDEDEQPNQKFLKVEESHQTRSAAYFLKGSNIPDSSDEEESDSDDDNKKVVKSAKDKLLEEMQKIAEEMVNNADLDEWIVVSKEFDKLTKLLTKSQQQNISTPKFYIKALIELEDAINFVSKDGPKLNAVTSKAFNSVKQRVKKAMRDFENLISKYRENPNEEEKKEVSATPINPNVIDEEILDIPTTLRSIVENRGKKNVNRSEQVSILENLLNQAKTPFQHISIHLLLIPTRFDLIINANYMPIDQWKNALKNVNYLLNILEKNNDKYRVSENAEPGFDFETEPEINKETGFVEILGSITSFVERLDDEFTKSLLFVDAHSSDYLNRLRDETSIYNLIVRTQLYVESLVDQKESIINEKNDQLFRIILRRIDHIYFKQTKLINFNEKSAWDSLKTNERLEEIDSIIIKKPNEFNKSYTDLLINSLCSILYRQSNSIYRKKAMLCHIYYYAINNEFFKARDMLLMSHLQSTIHTTEPILQVLFNRTLVQLGFCAFKAGLIEESFQILQEIATNIRQKELLGQGIQRYQDFNNNSSVAADKQRLLPFHMHINPELLEAVFLTCSLLIEIPQFAQTGFDNKNNNKKLPVKSFKKSLEFHDKQFFQGPPENTKDYIMFAAKNLQLGDWKKSFNYIKSIEIWKLFENKEKIIEIIKNQLKIEGLRTFIFQFKSLYSKLSIEKLSSLFELSELKINSILSKMIYKKEINAALDQKLNSIIFYNNNINNKLQNLSLELSDKSVQLAEKILTTGGVQQSSNFNSNSSSHHNHHGKNNRNVNFKINQNNSGIVAGALNGMDHNRRNKRR